MYEVVVKFLNGEKVTCVRDTFSKAMWWAKQFVRDGSIFGVNEVTDFSIKRIDKD